MADMMDTLKGLLGDNAEDKISGIMKILNSDSTPATQENNPPQPENPVSDGTDMPTITPEMIMAAQSIMSKLSSGEDDDRSRLLLSLKPYMRQSRQASIDSAVKMLNLAQMSQFFKGVI